MPGVSFRPRLTVDCDAPVWSERLDRSERVIVRCGLQLRIKETRLSDHVRVLGGFSAWNHGCHVASYVLAPVRRPRTSHPSHSSVGGTATGPVDSPSGSGPELLPFWTVHATVSTYPHAEANLRMHVGTTAHHVGFPGCRQSLGEEVVCGAARGGAGRDRRSAIRRDCQYTTLHPLRELVRSLAFREIVG